MQCAHTTKENKRCQAYALQGRDFCFTHDPSTTEARAEAVRKGGLASKIKDPSVPLKRLPARSPADTVRILEDTINRVRTEPMTPQQASCIASLVALSLKAMQMPDPADFNPFRR